MVCQIILIFITCRSCCKQKSAQKDYFRPCTTRHRTLTVGSLRNYACTVQNLLSYLGMLLIEQGSGHAPRPNNEISGYPVSQMWIATVTKRAWAYGGFSIQEKYLYGSSSLARGGWREGDILLLLGGKYSHKYNNIAALASDFPLWNIVVAVACFILLGRFKQAGPSYRGPKECFSAWYKFSERWSLTTFSWKRVPPFCRQKKIEVKPSW